MKRRPRGGDEASGGAGPLNKPDRARELAKDAHELVPNDAPSTAALGLARRF